MYKYIKRLIDFTLSGLALIIISPVYIILYILVLIKLGKPVFFKQKRTTKGCKVFEILKFRTMSDEKDASGRLLPDEKRKTKFGSWLRGSSLDELPEIFNIFKGNMSIIGPRPLGCSYDEYYTEYEKNRYKVRGGLLPPEILYDNPVPTWDEQLKWEADYANKLSFKTDLKIFMRCFVLIFKRSNNNYGDYVRKSLIEERKNK